MTMWNSGSIPQPKPKVSTQVADLEREVVRLKQELADRWRERPPFTRDEAAAISRDVERALGHTVYAPGTRSVTIAVSGFHGYAMRSEGSYDQPLGIRRIEVRW